MSRLAYITPEAAPDRFECRALFVPIGQPWQAIVTGILNELTLESTFESVGGLTEAQTAAIFSQMFLAWEQGVCPMFEGMIVPCGRSDAPDGWLLCDGTAYQIAQYPALYNAIGTTFGDNGAGTFRVPDMRSRKPIGAGQGTGLVNRVLGTTGGEESHLLTTTELPSHRHSIRVVAGAGAYYGWKPGITEGAIDGEDTGLAAGGGQAHNNMDPWLALNFVIYAGQ